MSQTEVRNNDEALMSVNATISPSLNATASTTTSFTIRPAVVADALPIAEIHYAGWQIAYTSFLPHEHIAAMRPSIRTSFWHEKIPISQTVVLVAEDDKGKAVGFVYAGDAIEGRDIEFRSGSVDGYDCEIYALHCHPSVHGKGIGRKLMAAVAKHFVERNYHALMLWAYRDNTYRRFYEKIGGTLLAEGIFEGFADVGYGWMLESLVDL